MTSLYFAYLLRLWQIDSPGDPAWRASLEDPHTRELIGFGSLQALCEYLQNLHFISSGVPSSSEEAKLHQNNL